MAATHVLHLIPTLSSGGAERQLVNLVRSTSKEKVAHTICAITQSGFFGPDIERAGGTVIDLGIDAKRPFVRAAAAFRRVIRESKPDIIHTWLYDANVAARLAVFLRAKVPMVTSLQLPDYDPMIRRIGNYRRYKVWGLRIIDKLTATVAQPLFVSCSDFVTESYREHFGLPKGKALTIYNSVDPGGLATAPGEVAKLRAEIGLSADAFSFLHVGRLDPQKNHATLLEAFRVVVATAPSSILLLVGVGPLEEKLKKLTLELAIAENVRFLGRRSDIGALLELADAFVFPSHFEGLGVALVEAMLKGRASVASRISVFQELIDNGETGLLIDPNSPADLARAMIVLHQSPALREKLGANAARVALLKFSTAATAAQWEDLYARLKEV